MSLGDLLIAGAWVPGHGWALGSVDLCSGESVWRGRCADVAQVAAAVAAARAAAESWGTLEPAARQEPIRRMASLLQQRQDDLAMLISRETGKPLWESRSEVAAMVEKVAVSIEALQERRQPVTREAGGVTAATIYKPHGVVAVFGPFNLPGHLPHGHIVPALLAGNAVVFKPSERTPAVGAWVAELWQQAGLPAGVLNLVQGGAEMGATLAEHPDIDGVYFTGGCATGLALASRLALQPQKILALEMGGNNPLVVDAATDLDAAAYLTIVSAYITAGQRCTCARRLILPRGPAQDEFLQRLIDRLDAVTVGPWNQSPEPFMGPVISVAAADRLLATQRDLLQRGATSLVPMRTLGPALLTPGLIDVTSARDVPDEEHFGPLLQVIRVPDFDAAIACANATRFGLSAGLISDDRARWERFLPRVRAGVVTWNRQTTGASGRLPFGGVGLSGNHRPSGYWAADYCSYPVAVMPAPTLRMPDKLMPGLAWSRP